MTRRGRPRASTETQRERVRRLAADEWSRRQIAKDVFGDARYRGRVERILRLTPRRLSAVAQPTDDAQLMTDRLPAAANGGSSLPGLVDRYRRSLARDCEPSLSEIERLLQIERQLATMEQVERLNALTREGGRVDGLTQ